MARHQFGPSVAGFAQDAAGNVLAGAPATAWDAETFGSQWFDMLGPTGAALVDGVIVSSDGSNGVVRGYRKVFGPDGVVDLWIDDGSGGRLLWRANDAGAGSGIVTTVDGVGPDGGGDVPLGAIPGSRQIIAGVGLNGGGNLFADVELSAEFGTIAGTSAEGNDARFIKALADLTNGPTDTPADDEVLTWNSATGRAAWETPASSTIAASDITSGTLALARLTPGSVVVADYYLTVYGAANSWPSSRPSSRADLVFLWVGPASPGGIMLAGDQFLKTA